MQSAETERHRLERHTTQSGLTCDAIIGLADGLTVPFALTAGLSSIGSSKLVILGGMAELFAGSISMGLGAYLATITDAHHFEVEEAHEQRQEISPIIESSRRNPQSWVKWAILLYRFVYLNRYIGGLIPMVPYFTTKHINTALFASIGVTCVILCIFGYGKTIITGLSRRSALYGSLETLLVGAIAAGASYGIVKLVNTNLDYT
ncbi:VIT family-domain-containing protein [Fusarium oxysporum Fo47]|uniref:VIT family-domain-containing protein n=1 Tax=Fusarium oxysporum Fo47 TaxID=660027 RepID=UPI002869C91F|nr:VIT family-domain-containing protein [Fusarium oxysporum Fo47]WJG37191.1 VIT family-domain-containing protein [Fusarium oxysporum Fo47]